MEFDYTESIETYRYLDSRAFCHIKTVRMRITLTPIFEEAFLLEFIVFKDTRSISELVSAVHQRKPTHKLTNKCMNLKIGLFVAQGK